MAFKKTSGASTHLPERELDLIRTLAGLLDETGLTEIELEHQGTRVRVSRAVTGSASTVPHPPLPASVSASPVTAAAPPVHADGHPGVVKSPMVGTVYRSPTPGAALFVEVGSEVKEGQTLLIIEAMKTMNQIPAPRAGRVTQVLVENGQPVEYGQALVVVE